ncbi:hypothetical protein ABK040_005152 [Willaertia magna]
MKQYTEQNPFRILVSGGGFSGLVFAHYLCEELDEEEMFTNFDAQLLLDKKLDKQKQPIERIETILDLEEYRPLPIQVTVVEKASSYKRVGAILTLAGQEIVDILNKEMDLSKLQYLEDIEIPFKKQSYYNKEGKMMRNFDNKEILDFHGSIKRFERALIHEKLFSRVVNLIHEYRFNTCLKDISIVNKSTPFPSTPREDIAVVVEANKTLENKIEEKEDENKEIKDEKVLRVKMMDKDKWMQHILKEAEFVTKGIKEVQNAEILHLRNRIGTVIQWMEKQEKEEQQRVNTFDDREEERSESEEELATENDIEEGSEIQTIDNCNNSSPRVTPRKAQISKTYSYGGSNTNLNTTATTEIEYRDFDMIVGADGINSLCRDTLFTKEAMLKNSNIQQDKNEEELNDDLSFKYYLDIGFMCFIVDLTTGDGLSNISSASSAAKSFISTQGKSKTSKIINRIMKVLDDQQTINVMLDQGRYFYCQRFGNKVYVTCIFKQEQEETEEDEEEEESKSSKSSIKSSKIGKKRKAQIYIPAEERKAFLQGKFSDCKFLCKDLIDLVQDSKTIYYDDLAQVRMPTWHLGSKVVLVGDSCHACTPLSGIGGTLAIIGAKTLALELRKLFRKNCKLTEDSQIVATVSDNQIEEAFKSYENRLMERVKQAQKKTVKEGKLLLTNSGFKKVIRDQCIRLLPKRMLMKMTKKDIK